MYMLFSHFCYVYIMVNLKAKAQPRQSVYVVCDELPVSLKPLLLTVNHGTLKWQNNKHAFSMNCEALN